MTSAPTDRRGRSRSRTFGNSMDMPLTMGGRSRDRSLGASMDMPLVRGRNRSRSGNPPSAWEMGRTTRGRTDNFLHYRPENHHRGEHDDRFGPSRFMTEPHNAWGRPAQRRRPDEAEDVWGGRQQDRSFDVGFSIRAHVRRNDRDQMFLERRRRR